MAIEVNGKTVATDDNGNLIINGKTIATDDNGNLINHQEWDKDVALALAAREGIELTQAHWDVLEYLREEYQNNNGNQEYQNNNGNQPMERQINKDMGKRWGKTVSSKDLYKLFPLAPSLPPGPQQAGQQDCRSALHSAQGRLLIAQGLPADTQDGKAIDRKKDPARGKPFDKGVNSLSGGFVDGQAAMRRAGLDESRP